EPYPLHDADTTIVSLIAAFYTERKPGFHIGAYASSPPIFDIRDFTIKNLDLDAKFGVTETRDPETKKISRSHVVVTHATHVDATGFLFMDPSDPLVPKFYFSTTPHAETAEVSIFEGEYKFQLRDLEVTQLAQLPTHWPDDPVANTLELAMTATSSDGARIHLGGAMLDYWDSPFGGTYDIRATVENAGPLLHDSVDSSMHGDDVTVTALVSGPILYPKLSATLERLGYDVPIYEDEEPLHLFLDRATVSLDMATEQGALDKAVARADQDGARGEIEVSANFGLSPYYLDAQLDITEPLEFRGYVPPSIADLVGTRVTGHLHARGDSDYRLEVNDLDLHVGLLHIARGTILAENEFEEIHFTDLGARLGDTTLTVDGGVDTEDETLDLTIDVDSGDLDRWLRRAGMTAFARRARGHGLTAVGSYDDPTIDGTLQLGGIPVIDDLDTTFSYGGGVVDIRRSRSTRIGDVRASGKVVVTGAPRAERIVVTARGLDLGKVPGAAGLVTGRADADLRVSGPLDPDRIHLDGTLRSDDLTVLGEPAGKVRACLDHDPNDPVCREAAAAATDRLAACADVARQPGGHCLVAGAIRPSGLSAQVIASTDRGGNLDGRVQIDQLAIDELARLAGSEDVPAGGRAAVQLDLAGTLGAPTADGALSLLRTWLLGAYFGDERLEVRVATTDDPATECADGRPPPARTDTGKVALCGQLNDGRIVVAAVLGTTAPFPAHVKVDLRRVEVDPFVDLTAMLGAPAPVRAWTSGTITVATELGAAHPALDVQLELPELALILARRDRDGRPAPLVVSAASPLSLHWDGVTATLGRPVRFTTPAGDLDVSGRATVDDVDLRVAGTLEVARLLPLLGDYFDDASGRVAIDAHVVGATASPDITAALDVEALSLRPTRQDTVVSVASARITLDPKGGLNLLPFTLAVDDSSSGEHAELSAHGGIKLDGITPVRWGVSVEGELAGKMLLAFAPEALSQASGVANLDLTIIGEGPTVPIQADLTFDPKHPFSLMPRGLRREIVLTGGQISLSADKISLDKLAGTIDDEGRLTGITGAIDLRDWQPISLDVTIAEANSLPFRIPRELDLVLSASELNVKWPEDEPLQFTGDVEIVQGRYIRNFQLTLSDLLPTPSTGAPAKPFWDEYPMIGDAKLDVNLRASSLQVANNIANIDLSGQLTLTGTPKDPRLEGTINVDRGTFKPQLIGARFTRTTGKLSFAHLAEFPSDTPTLDITSEADYRDSTGRDHLITLTLGGTLSHPDLDLSTSSGLNKGQTLTLLLGGKAPSDTQRVATDPTATDPDKIETSTNPTASYTDQLVKGLAGDFVSLLVADPLRDVSRLDVARIEVGTGSIGFHGEKKVFDNLNVIGDLEQTVRGRTIHVRVEGQTVGGFSVEIGHLRKNYDDPAEEDIKDTEAKLVYRWFP
ncbi:MAG: translocation/assembly module TamB domain-containing protein, partial [Myxococcales bacterium]|nr:translocation/assembly module TamB domain-containing protein [Myxococcales bacterium]